jgi:hypothetical protein
VRTVYKYAVRVDDTINRVELPREARIVHVDAQSPGCVTFWAEVDTRQPKQTRAFIVHGTGHKIDYAAGYVGTCLSGPFVWHLYEVFP